MSSNNRPVSPKQSPDPATSYERSKPNKEAGGGEVQHNPEATPTLRPDQMHEAVHNRQDGTRQINGDDSAAPARNKPA
jgi:hypothetical protein